MFELISDSNVAKALEHAQYEGMEAIREYWDMYMSTEDYARFSNSYVKFEACVRRRYNVMTGGTL